MYGLSFSSCIPLPALRSCPGTPDVRIRYGVVPDALTDPIVRHNRSQVAPGRLLFIVEGVAKYLVRDGGEIVIERRPGTSDKAVRTFLLGSVLSALLHQRGLLPLHGSAVEAHGRAAVFLARSGHGKSTLAAAFCQRAHRLLADDITVLRIAGDRILVPPGYPQQKLWDDALTKLNEKTDGLHRREDGSEKHLVTLTDNFCSDALPLGKLYILVPSDRADICLRPLRGAEKLVALTQHTYRKRVQGALNGKAAQFALCTAIAQRGPMVCTYRPRGGFFLEELVEILRKDLAKMSERTDSP